MPKAIGSWKSEVAISILQSFLSTLFYLSNLFHRNENQGSDSDAIYSDDFVNKGEHESGFARDDDEAAPPYEQLERRLSLSLVDSHTEATLTRERDHTARGPRAHEAHTLVRSGPG
jgi:hypothetical protein